MPCLPFMQSDCMILWLSISWERINWYLSFFMHAFIHQGKLAIETTTFGWVWSVEFVVKLDCRILPSATSLKITIWYLSLLMELAIKGRSHQRLLLLVGSGQLCASGQIGFEDSLVINISWRNQSIPLSGHHYFVFLFYLFLGIIYQTLLGSI